MEYQRALERYEIARDRALMEYQRALARYETASKHSVEVCEAEARKAVNEYVNVVWNAEMAGDTVDTAGIFLGLWIGRLARKVVNAGKRFLFKLTGWLAEGVGDAGKSAFLLKQTENMAAKVAVAFGFQPPSPQSREERLREILEDTAEGFFDTADGFFELPFLDVDAAYEQAKAGGESMIQHYRARAKQEGKWNGKCGPGYPLPSPPAASWARRRGPI